MNPWMLAGLLYLGSGIGLGVYLRLRGTARPRLNVGEAKWLAAAVLCGGVLAPVLLLYGLSALAASHAALLLNAEAVFTALLAWIVFKENFDRRIALGMAAIVAGALVLSWPQQALPASLGLPAVQAVPAIWPALAVVAACFFWALDNNFTRKVALADAAWIACVKGLGAGTTNLLLAFAAGAVLPSAAALASALGVGFAAYGVSLALFVVGLRHLGASRAGAYFSVAPFIGAVFSVLFLAEPVSWQLLAAAALMGVGIALHLTEHHAHSHQHEALEHAHLHSHDLHHSHDHPSEGPRLVRGQHSHHHSHAPVAHTHAHYPDAHHGHSH